MSNDYTTRYSKPISFFINTIIVKDGETATQIWEGTDLLKDNTVLNLTGYFPLKADNFVFVVDALQLKVNTVS